MGLLGLQRNRRADPMEFGATDVGRFPGLISLESGPVTTAGLPNPTSTGVVFTQHQVVDTKWLFLYNSCIVAMVLLIRRSK